MVNPILTDDERRTLRAKFHDRLDSDEYSAAVEAAVLAKMVKQQPIYQIRLCDAHWYDATQCAYAVTPAKDRRIIYAHPAPQQADRQRVPEGWREALAECADLAWLPDSHEVRFDSTVVFSEFYNFDNLESPRREEFLAEYECVVWPGSKWSAYCTYQGSMWFEQFDTAEEAKEACMRLLGKVLPDHPAMKARAMLAAAPEAPEQAVVQVPPGYKLVPVEALTRWRDAFAEELAAYDIDPPIHHVLTSHDEIAAMLAAAPEAPAQAACIACGSGSGHTESCAAVRWGIKPAPEAPAQASAVDERAAFEAWWKGDLLDWRGHQNTAALHAWEGWQARAALAQKGGK